MINKKGALTQKQIIGIVILIISFVVILAFLLMLNLKGEIDIEACRNSVSMRQIPFGEYVISLKCKTKEVCFSMGGDCEEVDETISIGNKEELMGKISNLFVDCWWMMGEGKVDYGSSGSCAICNKIFFNMGSETLTYDELYNYMANNKISDKSMSYLFYLYKVNNVGSIPNKKSGNIDFNEEYVVITKIQDKGNHLPPDLVKFSSKNLGSEGLDCSKYVVEV